MDATSINLPIVLQQAGDVSRAADVAQRHSQVQDAAAQQEAARRQELERSSVPRPERTDAENRVLVGDQGGGGGQAPSHEQHRRAAREAVSPDLSDEGGSLVDVLV